MSKTTAIQFLTVKEAAAKLRVSRATVYALRARGTLAHARISNALSIPVRDVDALLVSGRTKKK